jgi:hypothetical protein
MIKARFLIVCAIPVLAFAVEPDRSVTVNWSSATLESRSSLSIQVCPEPPMRRGSPIHDQLFGALRNLKADLARLQPWHPYPKLAVAELDPPKDGKTFWDFSVIDPIVVDFYAAAEGRPVMLNFGTIPEWMFKTDKPVAYPADPDEIDWNYAQGKQLRDPTLKEVVDYYHRLASWYMKGGFTDEYGTLHESGHHFKIDYWEVLNEVNIEHDLSPELYSSIYDAVVSDLRKLDPEMKFSGLAMAGPSNEAEYYRYYEYFLNRKNHKPGIPLDMISFHFYSTPAADESMEVQQHTIFAQAEWFLGAVRHVDSIRQRLSPNTKTYINELGTFSADPRSMDPKLPPSFWTLSGSMFAYVYPRLVEDGIDVIGAAELIDYPGQYPGTTLVDWQSGKPNARYWVVKLLKENFGPGDKLAATKSPDDTVLAQGFLSPKGEHKILLVNKRNHDISVSLPGAANSKIEYVDQTTGWEPPGSAILRNDSVTLRPQAVAVVTLPYGR